VGLATLTGPEETRANNLGVELAAAGRHEEAIPFFERAVTENPDYLPGHKNLLAACVETERWEQALASALKVEELHPLEADLRLPVPPKYEEKLAGLRKERDLIANLGRAHLENGRLDEAEARFRLLLALIPGDLRALNGLGEAAFRREAWDEALRLFALSLRAYGDQPGVVARLNGIAGEGPGLAGKVQWVLASYLEPKEGRPAMPELPGPPPVLTPGPALPIPDPEPVVRLPRAPVPEAE
jgi:tetratricopeptide (TPR) repeat protein